MGPNYTLSPEILQKTHLFYPPYLINIKPKICKRSLNRIKYFRRTIRLGQAWSGCTHYLTLPDQVSVRYSQVAASTWQCLTNTWSDAAQALIDLGAFLTRADQFVRPDQLFLIFATFDSPKKQWVLLQRLAISTCHPPALAVYQGVLVCVYLGEGNAIYSMVYTPSYDGGMPGSWSHPQPVSGDSSGGSVALVVIRGKLQLIFGAKSSNRELVTLEFSFSKTPEIGSWSRIGKGPEETTGLGVSAVYRGEEAYCIFIKHNAGDFPYILCSINEAGVWYESENTHERAADNPIAVPYENGLYIFFIPTDGTHQIAVTTRPINVVFTPSRWLQNIPNNTPFTSLAIPGTHDSYCGEQMFTLFGVASAQTQTLTLREQLQSGIRFLDFRLQLDAFGKMLNMVHGNFPVGLTLGDALGQVYSYLDHHPRETVLLSVKRDGSHSNDESTWSLFKDNYVFPSINYWYQSTSLPPTLGDARGKIVLLRRFSHNFPFGIAASWDDNVKDYSVQLPGDLTLRVQDNHEIIPASGNFYDSLSHKQTAIRKMLSQSYTVDDKVAFFNFISASYWYKSLEKWTPIKYARNLNPWVCISNCSKCTCILIGLYSI